MSTRFADFLDNLSGCTSVTLKQLNASNSQFIGSIDDNIQKFSSLQSLDLSNNRLNETISEKVWLLPELRYLDVSSNFFKGAISENIGRSKILNLYLSNSSLKGVPYKAHMQILSNIDDIDLSFCKLGPHFPKWIQKLKNLRRLNMAKTGISDTIPREFWSTWHSRLIFLNLSSNNISGKVTNLSSTFDPEFSVLDLSSNNFYGHVRNVPSSLERLNLSKNKLYGGISFLCQIIGKVFTFLDLSHNSFTGPIPDCLWRFKDLKVLSLGHNSLYGRLPASIEYLTNIEVLYLYNNKFSGELPLSLQNCTSLTFLELGSNKFSGCVPLWIGEKLSSLYTLSLASNNFSGTIPVQLCQLVDLQILDLSMNNLYGTIPSCLNNITAMVQNEVSHHQDAHTYYFLSAVCQKKGQRNFLGKYFDHAIIKWQGNVREFSTNLGLLKSIDLSSNNLSGTIPYELTSLRGLIALNLSNNDVLGEIPQNISEMKNLLTLDLSKNNISGGLPSSMSQMYLLNYLDVSRNNLSGRIPSSTQLQSFEPSRYSGNLGLCGLPLSKYCPEDKELEVPDLVGQKDHGGGEGMDELVDGWLYISGASGFATGFGIACGILLVNQHGRKAFFGFLDGSKDWFV